uniref:FCP1 homology domain-containing protein n=1 Tax=Odontella aurita TaxID=265563 RepID=A0A7S4JHH9_9STRA|mmetsp:Transcript_46605/g.141170  ORF Transcript_46605/g.141170 Transcript_46605/m.141170 type:complete len:235 (+) Transcript_46605:127-831(+)
MASSTATAIVNATRRTLLAITGGLGGYGVYKAQADPPHIYWDLDNTILCSITPRPPDDHPILSNISPSRYFDQIDDDFPFEEGTPNTRTYWRPGARASLKLCGFLGARQHVYTAAQGTYTANILLELDPDGTIFDSVTHRDVIPQPNGKDLAVVTESLDRSLLFDDRASNFRPQGGENGVLVPKYEDVAGSSDAGEVLEMAKLVGVVAMALLAKDARDVAQLFSSGNDVCSSRR